MPPEVSIVIPTFNHLNDCLKPCIESIMAHTDMSRVEVIVVANGCTDGTEEYLWSLNNSAIRVIRFNEPMGYTKSTNVGIQQARGEYVVLLNNDTVMLGQPRHFWIEQLKAPFLQNSNCGLTGVTKIYDPNTKYDFVIFYCAMTKKSIIEKIGLLDEGFNPGGGEDTDFSIRVQHAGYTIHQVGKEEREYWEYETHFPIYHAAEQTVHGAIPWDWKNVIRNNEQVLQAMYRKIAKQTIVLAATDKLEELQKCVNSLWKYTDYSSVDIVVVADKTNTAVMTYLKQVEPFGPYRILESDQQLTLHESYFFAMSRVSSEKVVFLSGKAILLEQPRNTWLNRLSQKLNEVGVGLSAVYIDGNQYSDFCFAAKRHFMSMPAAGYVNLVDCAAKSQWGTCSIGSGFPIYYNH